MKLTTLLAAALIAVPAAASAVTISTGEIPTSEYIVVDGDDWAWASPCGAVGGCNVFDIAEQSTYGWELATTDQVNALLSFVGGTSALSTLFGNGSICAAAWFNGSHSHCDDSNLVNGVIWQLDPVSHAETLAVRTVTAPPSEVPVPAAGLLVLTGLAAIGAVRRRA